jgi:hypothetical protein
MSIMINTVSSAPRLTAPRAQAGTVSVASSEPKGGGFSTASSFGDTLNLGSSAAHLYNGVKTSIDGGKLIDGDVAKIAKNLKNMKPLSGGMKAALSNIGSAALKMGQRSALFAGAISFASNGYKFYKKQIDLPTFGSRVVGDTAGGFAGGIGATIAGGIGMAILGGPIGLAGTALTIGGALAGMAGYVVAENMFRSTGIFKSIVGTVRSALGGMSKPYTA